MIDMMKKAMFAGVGIVALTKEKVEEIGRDFVDKGKLSEQEGKKFVDELLQRSNESKEAIRKQVDERIQIALAKANIAKSSDVEALKTQIKDLQATLDKKE